MQQISSAAAITLVSLAPLAAQSGPHNAPRPDLQIHHMQGAVVMPSAIRFDADGDFDRTIPASLDGYWAMSPIHQDMIRRLFSLPRERPVVHGCWENWLSPQAAALFTAAMQGTNSYQPQTRWSSTASSGGGLQYGDPTIIRYSFVPDGTFIPSGVGEPAANSNMFATLNAGFGSQTAWQNVVHNVFDRWEALTGLTYIYEPNDDGSTHGVLPGQINVRGDVRIGMKFIDGGSNILAYNAYPNDGDMVLDSGDSGFFSNPALNYRRFYNVLAHEHGHGLGIAHTCPVSQTKLMEPTITINFSGPQLDDILSGQRLYGDANEPNDNTASATDLGTLPDGTTNVTTQCIDGASDLDIFRFDVLSSKIATISAIPTGTPYLEGPQLSNGNCSAGTTFDPSQLRNLAIYLFNGTGTSLIQFSTTAPLGQPETLTQVPINGSYTVRVIGTGTNTIQPYRLQITIVDNGLVASSTPVGAGCSGLSWNALNDPVVGTTLVHTLTGITNPSQSIGLVLMGTTAIPGGLDLTSIGAPGCRVYQQSSYIVPVFPIQNPILVYTMPIPNNPQLSGTTFWMQGALLVPPGTNALGGITANATELFIGTQ